ncbi:hypothetical protein WG66_013795 [Moniliophthora roreri]|nr:hypothetical protein WG66_013795 [Moniliophthora roreri]
MQVMVAMRMRSKASARITLFRFPDSPLATSLVFNNGRLLNHLSSRVSSKVAFTCRGLVLTIVVNNHAELEGHRGLWYRLEQTLAEQDDEVLVSPRSEMEDPLNLGLIFSMALRREKNEYLLEHEALRETASVTTLHASIQTSNGPSSRENSLRPARALKITGEI